MYECIHRSKSSSERSASIEYGYMKQFSGILPLDVKIRSDTTYYHFNCGPLYLYYSLLTLNHLVTIIAPEEIKKNQLFFLAELEDASVPILYFFRSFDNLLRLQESLGT